LLQSVGGTITTIATGVLQGPSNSTTAQINSIQIVTLGNSITATAFSDSALVTSLGTLTSTQTAPTGNVSVGIIDSPVVTGSGASAPTQGSTVGPFSAI